MQNPIGYMREEIGVAVEKALSAAYEDGTLNKPEQFPKFVVEIPADRQNGDFACNVAMVGARSFRLAPRKIAEILTAHLAPPADYVERVEIAGPGFLNFYLSQGWFSSVAADVVNAGERYGRTDFGGGEKVQVEFVSANPTGPMHMGNARGGALGDVLAACLDWSGHKVEREFYVNDAGNQIEKFGASLSARYLQYFQGEENVPFAEDFYQGDDIRELAEAFAAEKGGAYVEKPENERRLALIAYGLPKNLNKLKSDLERYRVHYDNWFMESSLHPKAIQKALATLGERGMTYEKEGAVWYKATAMGAEKDEVLVRANGFPTYFAADIAYHYNKFAVRGFDRVINVWGADHHGHVARLKGAMDAMGLDGSKLDIVLMQLVRLMKNGEPYRMSKRSGKAVSLSDLLEEVPIDAARFFFNMREPGSAFDFDLDLAVEESSQNPVYYVQYAHARICTLLKRLAEEGVTPGKTADAGTLDCLREPAERALVWALARFPQEIIDAGKNYDPARMTKYVQDVAGCYHRFYDACPIKTAEPQVRDARVTLCIAAKTVIHNCLTLQKITVPESM